MNGHDLFLARRSIRRYTTQDVSREDEAALLQAAFAAPSAFNAKPWHFVIVREPHRRAELSTVHRWAWMLKRAPLVIGVLGRADATCWVEDCAAATENILLAATDLGLGSVWVGIWENGPEMHPDERRCLEILGAAPEKWRALCLVGIGHPAERKAPRAQYQPTKVSFDRFGKHER